MASYTLSPIGGAAAQFFDSNGTPLAGGKIYTYAAGTTTPQPTWTTPSGATLNTNPIILDSAGRPPQEIWLGVQYSYKFVIETSLGVLVGTYDNIPGLPQPPIVNDASSITYEQGNTVAAGAFIVGRTYMIATLGDTNFTAIGAPVNSMGTLFVATGAGAGTGTAYNVQTVENKLRQYVSVKDFGAVGDGIVDDTAAFNAAIASGSPVYVPPGTYKTNGAVTTPRRLYSNGASFTGTSNLDPYPAFGEGVFKVYATGPTNCIIGIVDNDDAAATFSFPTALTGYGRNLNDGNTVFGIYAEARQYANTGCVTNEIDSFNHASPPSNSLPPNRGIGTPEQQPIALTVGAGGDYNSSIGIHIVREGSSPQRFLTGIYVNPDSCVDYGMMIDANPVLGGPVTGAVIKNLGTGVNLRLITVDSAIPKNAVLDVFDPLGNNTFGLKQDGSFAITSSIVKTTVGANGAADPLTANPDGYIEIDIDGFTKHIPFYNS